MTLEEKKEIFERYRKMNEIKDELFDLFISIINEDTSKQNCPNTEDETKNLI